MDNITIYHTKIRVENIYLFLILCVSFVIRFWQLGTYPALNADEAAIGYNAFSLLETGKDEHGNPWPVHFQSFNDYKPGLYFYLVLPFVKVFGLNEWSVRIPNAFLGVLTVYLIYLLVKILLPRKPLTAITAAFFLAISPWHIHFSRGGWEVNTSTFLITLGVLLFIKFISGSIHVFEPEPQSRGLEEVKRSKMVSKVGPVEGSVPVLFLSVLSFALSLYTYHSARVIVPLLGLGFFGIYFKEIKINFKNFLLAFLLFAVVLVPLLKDFTRTDIASRAAGVGLFADPGPVNRVNEQRGEHENIDGSVTKIFHNKLVNYSLTFLKNWGAHYHGLFLFLSGDDIQRNKVPETGQMFMFDFLWIIIGLFWMAKNINKSTRFILHWLLIAPVAAALTFQSPHALRSQNMVIPFIIISAIGFGVFVNWLKEKVSDKKLLTTYYLIITSIILWQFARYQHMYWVHMAKEYPYSSQYGVKELVSDISQTGKDYSNVVVTTRYDQPYILFLFYLKYPPQLFQQEQVLTSRDQYGFSTVPKFGKFIFKAINFDEDRLNYKNSLIIGTPEEITDIQKVNRIYGSNGYEYFDIFAN